MKNILSFSIACLLLSGFYVYRLSILIYPTFNSLFDSNHKHHAYDGKQRSPEDIPKNIDKDYLYQNLEFSCEKNDIECIKDFLEVYTTYYGPQIALDLLSALRRNDKVESSLDTHLFAHVVGEQTARVYGISAESYLLCPEIAYFGGCQHGFLESSLTDIKMFEKIKNDVCATLWQDKYPEFTRFNCFHGLGHGILMMHSHRINSSLDLCNKISEEKGKTWCRTGVFNGASMHPEYFPPNDLIAECIKQPFPQSDECFKNLAAPHFINIFKTLDDSVTGCLSVSEFRHLCAGLIGSFSAANISEDQSEQKNAFGNIIKRCNLFPDSMIDECLGGAIQRMILNYSGSDFAQKPAGFCQELMGDMKSDCYREIIKQSLLRASSDIKNEKVCTYFPQDRQEDCHQEFVRLSNESI